MIDPGALQKYQEDDKMNTKTKIGEYIAEGLAVLSRSCSPEQMMLTQIY